MMKLNYLYYFFIGIIILIIINIFFVELFAQGPPPLPPAPRQVPWENFTLTLMLCIFYGIYKITQRKN